MNTRHAYPEQFNCRILQTRLFHVEHWTTACFVRQEIWWKLTSKRHTMQISGEPARYELSHLNLNCSHKHVVAFCSEMIKSDWLIWVKCRLQRFSSNIMLAISPSVFPPDVLAHVPNTAHNEHFPFSHNAFNRDEPSLGTSVAGWQSRGC